MGENLPLLALIGLLLLIYGLWNSGLIDQLKDLPGVEEYTSDPDVINMFSWIAEHAHNEEEVTEFIKEFAEKRKKAS